MEAVDTAGAAAAAEIEADRTAIETAGTAAAAETAAVRTAIEIAGTVIETGGMVVVTETGGTDEIDRISFCFVSANVETLASDESVPLFSLYGIYQTLRTKQKARQWRFTFALPSSNLRVKMRRNISNTKTRSSGPRLSSNAGQHSLFTAMKPINM